MHLLKIKAFSYRITILLSLLRKLSMICKTDTIPVSWGSAQPIEEESAVRRHRYHVMGISPWLKTY